MPLGHNICWKMIRIGYVHSGLDPSYYSINSCVHFPLVNRESYMSAHILLNLLNELEKNFCHYVRNVVMDVITFPRNL